MRLADYVIKFFGDNGIKDVFLVYGAANGDLVDAFTRCDNVRYIAVMHEQAGGFAAEGYAKVSGKPGVALATSGPGGMNFVTCIGNCYYDSVPCIFLTGQIKSQFMRPHPDIRQIGFQETDIVSIVKPITKYAKMITDPKSIKYELEKAMHISMEGRPGPVLLDMPIDLQKAEIDPDKLSGYDVFERNWFTSENENKVDLLIKDLIKSKRPAILVGGGIKTSKAIEVLLELGKNLKIPMFPTWNAIDVVSSDFPYYGGRVGTYGGPGRNFGIQNSDLLIVLGSRISGRITGGNPGSFARGAKKYVVDIDEIMLHKIFQQTPCDVCIHSDVKDFIYLMLKKISNLELPNFSSWMERVINWREKYTPLNPEFFAPSDTTNPYVFVNCLSKELVSGDIIVTDCGGNVVVTNQAFETKRGQFFFSNNGNSPMGFSFSGGLGAAVAAKNGQNTVCIIGDGGFNMNIQELQTLLNYNIKLKTFIMNNHIYGITKAYQETNFFGRSEACGPKGYSPPDFTKITEAYGVKTIKIDGNDPVEISKKIKEVLSFDGPVVCDVNCHEWHTYDPKIIGWQTPIEDMYPYLPEEEFLDNMIIPPLDTYKNRHYPSIASGGNP